MAQKTSSKSSVKSTKSSGSGLLAPKKGINMWVRIAVAAVVIGGGIFIKFASHASTPPTGGGGTGWKFVSTSKITEGNGTYATFNAYACTKPTTTQYYTVYEKLVTVTSTIKGGYVQATLDIAGSVALGTRVAAVKGNYSIAAQYTIYTPSSAVIKPGVQLNPTSPTGSNTTGGTTRVTANSLPYCP